MGFGIGRLLGGMVWLIRACEGGKGVLGIVFKVIILYLKIELIARAYEFD